MNSIELIHTPLNWKRSINLPNLYPMKTFFLVFILLLSNQIFANPPINPTRYANFLVEKISSQKFTSDGEKMVRDAASNWAKLANSGKFENVYSSDAIGQTYTFNTNNLPSNLMGIDFKGSPDQVKINAFGQTVIKNRGDANSLIANLTSEYLSSYPEDTRAVIITDKIIVEFGPVESYIKEIVFGGNANYLQMWAARKQRLGSTADIKKHIMRLYRDYNDWHHEKMVNPEEFAQYMPIKGEKLLLDAIANNDWNSFVIEANKFGSDPDGLVVGF